MKLSPAMVRVLRAHVAIYRDNAAQLGTPEFAGLMPDQGRASTYAALGSTGRNLLIVGGLGLVHITEEGWEVVWAIERAELEARFARSESAKAAEHARLLYRAQTVAWYGRHGNLARCCPSIYAMVDHDHDTADILCAVTLDGKPVAVCEEDDMGLCLVERLDRPELSTRWVKRAELLFA